MSEKSQNGWPASKDPAAINIKAFPIAGTKIKLRCAAVAGKLLAGFATEFHEKVEPLEGKTFDDWSYAYRNVRGDTDNLSNHASGTAIDLNALWHPLGKRDTFTKEQQAILDVLCKKYGLRGGYTYKTRPDDMHFEINCSKAEAKKLVDELGL
jgi:hypothetical protein